MKVMMENKNDHPRASSKNKKDGGEKKKKKKTLGTMSEQVMLDHEKYNGLEWGKRGCWG